MATSAILLVILLFGGLDRSQTVPILGQNVEGDATPVSGTQASVSTTKADTHDAHDGCKDRVPDCAEYDKSICEDEDSWARENCQYFCGKCKVEANTAPAHSTQASVSTTTADTHEASGGCTDKLADCDVNGQRLCEEHPSWARENCQAFCGIC